VPRLILEEKNQPPRPLMSISRAELLRIGPVFWLREPPLAGRHAGLQTPSRIVGMDLALELRIYDTKSTSGLAGFGTAVSRCA
jgi:hypothetical protein